MKKILTPKLIFSIILCVAGAGYIGNALGMWQGFTVFFRGWWTLFIIIPAVVSLLKGKIKAANFIWLGIGVLLFLKSTGILVIGFRLAVGLILLFIGASIIIKSISKAAAVHKAGIRRKAKIPSYTARFGYREFKPDASDALIGASVGAYFANTSVDFSDCTIDSDILFDVNAVFGKVYIKLPPNLRVELTSRPLFGTVTNRCDNNIVGGPAVLVSPFCFFGSVEIS